MGFPRKGLLRRSYAIVAVLLLLSILQLPIFARTATTSRAGSSSPASVTRAAEFNVGCNVTELINAINTANGNGEADTINLGAGCTYTLTGMNNTTDGPNGLPSITSQITINGNGATIERSSAGGTPEFRIFHVANGGSLTLNDLTISNGNAGNNSGGGIYSAGTLIIDESAINNDTSRQGGVYSSGTAEITEATISNNTATYGGGGIRKDGGTLSISKSTLSGNLSNYGGGVYNKNGEDFTTYTEVDPNNHITVVAANHVQHDSYRNEDAHLYADKGIGYFSGDFVHKFQLKVESGASKYAHGQPYTLANAVADRQDLSSLSSFLWFEVFCGPFPTYDYRLNFYFFDLPTTTFYRVAQALLDYDTDYYVTLRWASPYFTVNVYSDPDRTVLVDSDTRGSYDGITYPAPGAFRYVYAANTDNDGYNKHCVVHVYDLDLGPTDTDLAVAVDAPSALEVQQGRYVPNPFTVTATVTNTGNLTATNAVVSITLPISLTLEGGQSPTQPIGELGPDQSQAATWSVTAITQTRDITVTYTLEAMAENADAVTETKEIFIPGMTSLDIVPLEQTCLLRYTNVKGQWQAAATRTMPEWLSVITSTVPVTVTAVLTNTGVITAEAVVMTITLLSDLALVTGPYPAATVPLGDIAAGQAVSTTWCITKTSPIAPSGSYSWPVTLTVGAANAALTTRTDEIKVEKVYDSGYAVDSNAYEPQNSHDPNEMGPIDWSWSKLPRRWDVFRQVYQHEPLPPWWLAPLCHPALEYFLTVHKAIFGAYCTGMSVSNGDRLRDCDDLPAGPDCPNLYALSADDIRDEVEMYQGRFLTREVLDSNIPDWWRANRVDPIVNNEAVYNAIKQTIVSNSTDRRVLDFLPKAPRPTDPTKEYWQKVEQAHAVVPYMTTETEDEKHIFVYDPNFPYSASNPTGSIKAVRIHDIHDTEDCLGCFEYEGSVNYSDYADINYTEHGIPNALVTAPISLYREAGHSPVPDFIIAGVLSPVHLAMVDDQGRTIGVIEDGSFVAEIPGSAPIFGLDHEAFALPADEGQHYLAILRGYETGTYSYYQFQRDGLYRIQDANALPTTVDEVDVSAAGDRMSYSTNDPSKTYSAIIYRQTPDFTRVFTVANTSLAVGEVVTFEVSAGLATFKYVNPGGAKSYDLGLEQTGVYSGSVSFDGLQMGDNEAHIITAEDWDRLETTRIALSIDQDNDGTIEEVVVLQAGYVIFAGSQACDKTIHWSGSGNKVRGNIHSNNDIKISGSDNTITGLTEYVTGIKVGGSNNVYTPTESSVLPLPAEYDIEDYKPGGVAAEAAQEEGRYHYIGGDLKVSSSGEVLDGLYYVTGDVKLSGSELSGEVTIIAQGWIHASGSNHSFTPYSGDLLFFSEEGYGGQKGCSKAVIKVSGSGMIWDGVVYAPGGLIQVSGSNCTLKGRLIGGSLKVSGSNLEIGFHAE